MDGIHAARITWWRDSQKFSHRFRVTIASDANTIESEGTMKKEGGAWEPDLYLSYVRVKT